MDGGGDVEREGPALVVAVVVSECRATWAAKSRWAGLDARAPLSTLT